MIYIYLNLLFFDLHFKYNIFSGNFKILSYSDIYISLSLYLLLSGDTIHYGALIYIERSVIPREIKGGK